MPEQQAIILISGGLDSATTAAIAADAGYQLFAMSFRYGQRHSVELVCAEKVARATGVRDHKFVDIDLAAFGGSALTNVDMEIPKDRLESQNPEEAIPVTYVPARNTIFLSYALGWAEVLGAFDIFIGVNATDYSGYPDCRGEFIEAYQNMANLATATAVQGKGRYTIHTPIIKMTKAQIIKTGSDLGVDYSLTHSCYDPDPGGKACGRCDSCQIRLRGFRQAGLEDPVEYNQKQ